LCVFHLAHCRSLASWMNWDRFISSNPFMCQFGVRLNFEISSLSHVVSVAVLLLRVVWGWGWGGGGRFLVFYFVQK
jgi:hypothetical protein